MFVMSCLESICENSVYKELDIVPSRSFHTNINYFTDSVKKKNLRGEVRNVKQTKLINSTV
jgi:hypothetical protein